MLTTTEQVFFFVPHKLFELSKPESILIHTLQSYLDEYAVEITALVRILLKMFADGFEHQKGAIFGFGKDATKDTPKHVAKICSMDEKQIKKLDDYAQTHNIGEQRNVGMTNHELSIRGKEHINTVSRKLVLNRSSDLILKNSTSFTKYKKEADLIRDIRLEWSNKMKELQRKGYEAKDVMNLKKDATKLDDLELLKKQTIAGPFATSDDVESYMNSNEEHKSKQDRLYIEVRYAKSTCLSMNTQTLSKLFRLRRGGKKLDPGGYADCLKKYFDTSRSLERVTLPDLQNTLGELEKSFFIVVGEHIAVFWIVKDSPEWFLAVVDNVHDDDIDVLPLCPTTRKNKTEWAYPQNSKIYPIDLEKVVMRKITVGYLPTERIKCVVPSDVVLEIEKELNNIMTE